jgi:AAHS family benzoate transporter-like MFS transporter
LEARPEEAAGPQVGRLHRWWHPPIVAAAALVVTSGFAQFGVSTTLGDVARSFGRVVAGGSSVAEQLGLSGTVLAGGLAIIRLSSLASLPLAGLADRLGRRRVLLGCSALGLALTALAAASPGYWWFVALFALARPLLSATNAVAQVVAAEETESRDRATALALLAAGYGTGAGLTGLVRGVAGSHLGWRGVFALVLLPLAALPLLGRRLEEPERYRRLQGVQPAPSGGERDAVAAARPRLGHVRADLRGRLWLLGGLVGALSLVTGPANTLLFAYGENALGMRRATTALVVLAAGPVGLGGLALGRWAADRVGRRWTVASMQLLVALSAMVTYGGSVPGAIAGYLLAILFGGAFAPALAALAAELFPTSARATVAGWVTAAGVLGAAAGLLLFGRLLDASNGFLPAMAVLAVPVALVAPLYGRLPETRGLELEESAPELPQAPA